jgi:hypothetical protein
MSLLGKNYEKGENVKNKEERGKKTKKGDSSTKVLENKQKWATANFFYFAMNYCANFFG